MNTPEKPMSEAQWETLLKESDLRAARFGELLETLIDDPNRDEIIAHEMGWNDQNGEDDDIEQFMDLDASFDGNGGAGAAADPAMDSFAGIPDDDDNLSDACDPPDTIPAYVAAMAAADLIREALQPILDNEDDEEIDERLSEVFLNIHTACAKISGGHAMGYDDDVLCGNIVCNKIALDAVEKSLDALRSLRNDDLIDPVISDRLLPPLHSARRALAERITELRKQVWW